ncbi:TolC family protein [Myxococcota bacterium]
MRNCRGRLFGLLAGLLMPAHLGAQTTGSRPVVASPWEASGPPVRVRHQYGLRECLALAQRNYPKIAEAKAKLDRKRGERQQASFAPFADLSATAGLGPAPTVRGTSLYSPNADVALSRDMALAWQVGVDGTLPLWTFGKLDSVRRAADANVRVGQQEVRQAQNEGKLAVRRAYYGAQLARDSRELVREAMRRIDQQLGSLARRVESGDADEVDLIKARMHRAELTARASEARKQERLALSGLKFLTGVKGTFSIPDQPLRQAAHQLRPLATYLAAARLHRPEVNMARAGVLAKRAQLELERSRFFPDVGVSLYWRWARAPEVTDQRNPFVVDSGNYHRYGAHFGLRWKLDFLSQSARLQQAKADLEQMRAVEQYALGGVAVEVEHAFEEAHDAARRMAAYDRAVGYARQWLIKIQQGIDVGMREEEDVIDPAKEYALKRFSLLSATLDYNLAVARLALATGWDGLVRD